MFELLHSTGDLSKSYDCRFHFTWGAQHCLARFTSGHGFSRSIWYTWNSIGVCLCNSTGCASPWLATQDCSACYEWGLMESPSTHPEAPKLEYTFEPPFFNLQGEICSLKVSSSTHYLNTVHSWKAVRCALGILSSSYHYLTIAIVTTIIRLLLSLTLHQPLHRGRPGSQY